MAYSQSVRTLYFLAKDRQIEKSPVMERTRLIVVREFLQAGKGLAGILILIAQIIS